MNQRDMIAEIIREASRADERTVSAAGAEVIADALLERVAIVGKEELLQYKRRRNAVLDGSHRFDPTGGLDEAECQACGEAEGHESHIHFNFLVRHYQAAEKKRSEESEMTVKEQWGVGFQTSHFGFKVDECRTEDSARNHCENLVSGNFMNSAPDAVVMHRTTATSPWKQAPEKENEK